MKTTFEELKKEFIAIIKPHSPCSGEFRRVLESTNEKELLKVISDNLNWCISENVLHHDFFEKFDRMAYLDSGIANTGIDNTGFANSGDWNSGNWNSGDWNSGNRNSGDRNSGDWNSGDRNSGDSNSGNWNSGDSNSGDWNSGDRNSGNRNSGDSNSGDWNSGDRNSGDWNSGDWNSGDRNSGDWNSGNWNSGNRNSGDSNSGYRNSGAFCLNNDPIMWLFDKPCKKMTVRQWEQTRAYSLMGNLDFTFWIPASAMTEQEKKDHPKYETTEGYLKTIGYKEGWANFWGNLSKEDRKEFTSLENFDAEIFKSITGITV